MAWTNIFDLADWDVYVMHDDGTNPDPNCRTFFVRIEDFPSSVGTIAVEQGVIVCSFLSTTEGNPRPAVIVVPSGTPPEEAMARVTVEFDADDSGVYEPLSAPEGAYIVDITGMEAQSQPDEFDALFGTVEEDLDDDVVMDAVEYPAPIPSGNGLQTWINGVIA